jgi:hypothetical protein
MELAVEQEMQKCLMQIACFFSVSHVGCRVAFGLGVGTGILALSDDDHWSVCDPRRVFDNRLKRSLRSQEPHLVHRVVERGSWGDYGRSVPPRCRRARSSGGRCACAHSRCGYPCSADAADRATEWPRESISTRLDARLNTCVGDVTAMPSRTQQHRNGSNTRRCLSHSLSSPCASG